MKRTMFAIRCDAEQRDRWNAALEKAGQTKTAVCTAALDRFAKRIEKEAQNDPSD